MSCQTGSSTTLRQELAARHVMVTGKDGETYLFRPISPADAPSLMRGYDAMSDEAKWFRMLHTVPHLTREMAQRFCSPNPERDLCVVIEGHGRLTGEILGGARIACDGAGTAEFSVSLRPEAQGLGLAHHALEAVLKGAAEMGCKTVLGTIAAQNTPMLALARHIGFRLAPDPGDPSLIIAEIELPKRCPENAAL